MKALWIALSALSWGSDLSWRPLTFGGISMHSLDRIVAGVSCREVLAALSDMVDGTLPAERVEHLRAHVAECHVCEQFGARFQRAIQTLRESASSGLAPLSGPVSVRVRRRLAAEYVRSGSGDLG